MLLYETLVIDAMTGEPFTENRELGIFAGWLPHSKCEAK